MRELPKVRIGRTEFYVDERLSQIRVVNNPHLFEDISPEVIAYLLTQSEVKDEPVLRQAKKDPKNKARERGKVKMSRGMAQAIAEWEQRQENRQLIKPQAQARHWLCSCDNCRMNRRIDKARGLKRTATLMIL